jgi:molybdate transport system substrate-binding protein
MRCFALLLFPLAALVAASAQARLLSISTEMDETAHLWSNTYRYVTFRLLPTKRSMPISTFFCRFRSALIAAMVAIGPSAQAQNSPKPLLIAAAADLKFALDDVLIEFKKAHPEHEAKPTYGSSGTLFAQLNNGAPFDLFLSADVKFPRKLIDAGRGEKDSLFLYAIGHLVVWAPKDSPLDVKRLGTKALTELAARKIAIANPDVAPYGAAAVAALKKLGVYESVQSKLVLGENVAQTAQFVQSGAADIGVISLSLALAPKMKDVGKYWDVPSDAFPTLEQAGVIRVGGANPAGAAALREFLISPAGRTVLSRYGFVSPGESK